MLLRGLEPHVTGGSQQAKTTLAPHFLAKSCICWTSPAKLRKLAPVATAPRPRARRETKKSKVLVLHGPNLNLLGSREPDIYGKETLKSIDGRLVQLAKRQGAELECFQSNHEGELIDRVQQAKSRGISWIIINPGGYTHTSVALRDALAAGGIPFVEVHLSNIQAREAFRQKSYFSDLAVGTISGLGSRGYDLAVQFVLQPT
jgi:3-dehydroquinate dehydratase-2